MKTWRAVLFALLAGAATVLHAHDSWLVNEGDAIALVTGTRFPKAEIVPPADSVASRGCATEGSARACWIELREFEIVLEPKIVDVYFREARPADSVVARWHGLHATGKEWRERYRKFARIEIAPADATDEQRRSIRQPANLDLELLPIGNRPFETGSAARFVLLSKGQPVAGRAVELISDKSPIGLWSRTDERGEVQWPLPFAANWLVRTILLEPDGADRWRSRFATFAFEAR
jgi:uncharacterized GH25 family protein